ncbi:hypothetical protein HRbin36_01713 [bacterium HR36]|nr:hypothetical protein HRbin36_01713 [bacterium HR36]
MYAFPLPRDAALQRFRILGPDFDVTSQLRPTHEAVEEYEKALQQGHLAGLSRQYRDGLVNLNLGNLRPDETVIVYLDILAGVELHDRGLRFRFPFTLAPCYHPKARAVAVAPGIGEMELPESFGDVLLPQWVQDAGQLHGVGFELRVRMPAAELEIGSPSHAITVGRDNGTYQVRLAREKDVPNRDLILDVRSAANGPTITGGLAQDKKAYFAVVLPSHMFGKPNDEEPKQVVFVLDRSGSMAGQPLHQAKRALEACLGAMREGDQFSIVAFDSEVETLSPTLLPADSAGRQRAKQFLSQIEARGGTELTQGLLTAVGIIKEHGGAILVLTDGQVFGTEEILQQIRQAGVRVHCLGIGSASQDRFLALLARETGGTSRFLAPRERVDQAAVEMFAAIGTPVASQLRLENQHPDAARLVTPIPQQVFAGSPLLLLIEAEKPGEARLGLVWENGQGKQHYELTLPNEASADAETVRLIQGARQITDLEAQCEEVPGSPISSHDRRDKRILKALEKLSQQYGLASRAMSLVAVVKRKSDVPGDLPQTVVVPVGMPEDVEFSAYFVQRMAAFQLAPLVSHRKYKYMDSERLYCLASAAPRYCRLIDLGSGPASDSASEIESEPDLLIELAARMESDGGLSGKTEEERWLATVIALACFLSAGQSVHFGPFRLHLQRLQRYLENSRLTASDPLKRRLVQQLQQGKVPPIPWQHFAKKILAGKRIRESRFWKAVRKAL